MDIIIRNAEIEDCQDIYNWRNDPVIREKSFNSEEIIYNSHVLWFKQKLKNDLCRMYIFEKDDKKVGVIRFDINSGVAKVSVMLNPYFFGKKFGAVIIRIGTEKFMHDCKEIKKVIAEIKKTNKASLKAFLKADYNKIDEEIGIITALYEV